jgi:hypothetical protein
MIIEQFQATRAKGVEVSEIAGAKRAFTTRRVPQNRMRTLLTQNIKPEVGDLVLAEVQKIGSHARLELPTGRRADLSVGDRIIVAYGNRYAPDQFEAIIGPDLAPCDLVAAGGVASVKRLKHDAMSNPTRIKPIGLVGDASGRRINLADHALPLDPRPRLITTVLVAGTSMNAGKTMTAAALVNAFAATGRKVAGIKSTGTGAGGDLWLMSDMGASVVLDFTDAGMPSTYLAPPEQIEAGVLGLIGHAADVGCDVAVVEVADGLQHEETARVLGSPAIRAASCGIVFAANDALGAFAGIGMLKAWDHTVLALSGQMTRSPLAIREASRATGMAAVTLAEIRAGALNSLVFKDAGFVLQPELEAA